MKKLSLYLFFLIVLFPEIGNSQNFNFRFPIWENQVLPLTNKYIFNNHFNLAAAKDFSSPVWQQFRVHFQHDLKVNFVEKNSPEQLFSELTLIKDVQVHKNIMSGIEEMLKFEHEQYYEFVVSLYCLMMINNHFQTFKFNGAYSLVHAKALIRLVEENGKNRNWYLNNLGNKVYSLFSQLLPNKEQLAWLRDPWHYVNQKANQEKIKEKYKAQTTLFGAYEPDQYAHIFRINKKPVFSNMNSSSSSSLDDLD